MAEVRSTVEAEQRGVVSEIATAAEMLAGRDLTDAPSATQHFGRT